MLRVFQASDVCVQDIGHVFHFCMHYLAGPHLIRTAVGSRQEPVNHTAIFFRPGSCLKLMEPSKPELGNQNWGTGTQKTQSSWVYGPNCKLGYNYNNFPISHNNTRKGGEAHMLQIIMFCNGLPRPAPKALQLLQCLRRGCQWITAVDRQNISHPHQCFKVVVKLKLPSRHQTRTIALIIGDTLPQIGTTKNQSSQFWSFQDAAVGCILHVAVNRQFESSQSSACDILIHCMKEKAARRN